MNRYCFASFSTAINFLKQYRVQSKSSIPPPPTTTTTLSSSSSSSVNRQLTMPATNSSSFRFTPSSRPRPSYPSPLSSSLPSSISYPPSSSLSIPTFVSTTNGHTYNNPYSSRQRGNNSNNNSNNSTGNSTTPSNTTTSTTTNNIMNNTVNDFGLDGWQSTKQSMFNDVLTHTCLSSLSHPKHYGIHHSHHGVGGTGQSSAMSVSSNLSSRTAMSAMNGNMSMSVNGGSGLMNPSSALSISSRVAYPDEDGFWWSQDLEHQLQYVLDLLLFYFLLIVLLIALHFFLYLLLYSHIDMQHALHSISPFKPIFQPFLQEILLMNYLSLPLLLPLTMNQFLKPSHRMILNLERVGEAHGYFVVVMMMRSR